MWRSQTVLPSPRLARAVGQHLRRLARLTGIDQAHLIQAEQGVTVTQAQGLHAVARAAPGLDVPAHVAPAPYRAGHMQGRGFAPGAFPPEVKTSPLQAGQMEQGSGKGGAQGEGQAGVAGAVAGDAILPALEIPGRLEGVTRAVVGLQQYPFAGRVAKDLIIGQHEDLPMPADPIHAAPALIGPGVVDVLGEGLTGKGVGLYLQAQGEQDSAILIAVAVEQLHGHGPGIDRAFSGLHRQMAAPVAQVKVPRLGQHPQLGADPHPASADLARLLVLLVHPLEYAL